MGQQRPTSGVFEPHLHRLDAAGPVALACEVEHATKCARLAIGVAAPLVEAAVVLSPPPGRHVTMV